MKHLLDRERISLTELDLDSNITLHYHKNDKPYIKIDGNTYAFGRYCDFTKIKNGASIGDYVLLRKPTYACIIEKGDCDRNLDKIYRRESDYALEILYHEVKNRFPGNHFCNPVRIANTILDIISEQNDHIDILQDKILELEEELKSIYLTSKEEMDEIEQSEIMQSEHESEYDIKDGCVVPAGTEEIDLDEICKTITEFATPKITMEQLENYIEMYRQYRTNATIDGDTYRVCTHFEGAIQKACELLNIDNTYKVLEIPGMTESESYKDGLDYWQS